MLTGRHDPGIYPAYVAGRFGAIFPGEDKPSTQKSDYFRHSISAEGALFPLQKSGQGPLLHACLPGKLGLRHSCRLDTMTDNFKKIVCHIPLLPKNMTHVILLQIIRLALL